MEIDRDYNFEERFLRFILAEELFPYILRQSDDWRYLQDRELENWLGSGELPPLPFKRPKREVDNNDDHHNGNRCCIKENTCLSSSRLRPVGCPAQLQFTEPKVKVHFLGFKQEYEKVQSRVNRQSRQRIAEGKVRMRVTADAQISSIEVYVERAPLAATLCGDVTGRVPLQVKLGAQITNKQYLSVDLDSVYMSSQGTPVYKLSTVDSDRRNRFRLVVIIVFIDGSQSRAFVSPTFLLRSRRPERLKST